MSVGIEIDLEVYGETRQQRCWMHKTGNVLNYAPKSVQPKINKGVRLEWHLLKLLGMSIFPHLFSD